VCGHGSGDMDLYDEVIDRFRPVELEEKTFPSLYPGLHVLPSHSVFYSRTGWGEPGPGGGPYRGDDQSAYFTLTAATSGAWTGITPAAQTIADRTKGMSVLHLSSAPPYARILVFGGADPATNDTYETIDASSVSPASSWSAPVTFPDREHRSLCSAVLLPDGAIFLGGGIQRNDSPCALFDPRTNRWLPAAELPSQRDYHSVALLLPSAKVMMAGWLNPTIEVYSPPYLFHGPRPIIRSAPDTVRHGQRFHVETPESESIAKAVLVRPMAVTHQTDTEQRVIELAFERISRDRLIVSAPDGGDPHSLAPRGYYMLFLLNHEGVPSVARWIRLISPSWQGWLRIGEPTEDVPQRSVVWPVSRNPDRIDIFVIGNNGGIYTSGQTSAGTWEAWHPVGNPGAGENVPTNSVVSAVARTLNRLDIFVVGHNGGIYTSGQTNGAGWEGWHPIGNPGAGENVPIRSLVWPASRHADRIDIFVVGNNGGIYTSGQNGGGAWEPWHPIGNPGAGENVPTSSVVSAVARGNRLDVFVVGHNGGIYTSGQTNGGLWEGWHPIGNPAAGHTVPSRSVVFPISRSPGRLDIFVVGHNGGIYTTGQSGGGAWDPWHPVGNPGAGENVPTNSVVWAVSHLPNRLDIFVVGHNGGIYTNGQTNVGAWEGWHPVGNPEAGENVPTNSVVSAVARKPEQLDVFVVGHNGGIYRNRWE
jgi:Domain of unknown function (DUF1929)